MHLLLVLEAVENRGGALELVLVLGNGAGEA